MLVIPAIDLRGGRCVRLFQGQQEREMEFSKDPVKTALGWCEQGAQRLHIVDLDGAFNGSPMHVDTVAQIINAVSGVEVQVGGGIRTIEHLQRYFDMGVSYQILGTGAVANMLFVEEACSKYAGQVMLGLDVRDGKIAVKGWQDTSSLQVADIMQRYQHLAIAGYVHTNISRDGTMEGVDGAAVATVVEQTDMPVIAAGGVHTLADVKLLAQLTEGRLHGVIAGRSLYEGTLELAEAIQWCKGYSNQLKS